MTSELELRVLIGVPGSGKSTIAKEWLDTGEVDAIVSSDAIRKEITGSEECFDAEGMVWYLVKNRIDNRLRAGQSVVLDATNVTSKYRSMWKALAERWGAKLVAYRVNTPWSASVKRNSERDRVVPDDVMETMWRGWIQQCDFRTLHAEGFDLVKDIQT